MKITFIYAHEEGEVWSTPMSLVNEFKARGWKTDIVSIGSNRTGIYDDKHLQLWIQQDIPTDIVMFMDWGRFDSPWLDKSLKPSAFWIQESGDDPQNFSKNSAKSNKFDLVITPDHESYLKYTNLGRSALWVPHFADTRVQYPMHIPIEYIAVTTRGYGNSQVLDEITRWGDGSIGNRNGMDGIEHAKFLNSGLMVIQNSRWEELTRRIFEGMACCKLVITDRLPENRKLDLLFEEGKEIVLYNDIQDFAEKITYYYEHEDERNKIAQAGYDKVLNNYTQKQVVDKLIHQWTSYLSAQVF